MLDLNLIQIFLLLAKCKNLNLAAKKLHVTPPALSHRIKALEDTVGCTLFLRKRTGMELNSKGKEFYNVCIGLNGYAKQIESWVFEQQGKVAGTVSLTVIGGLTGYLLPGFLRLFTKKYPEVKIVINTVLGSAHVEDKLIQGDSDIGIIAGSCQKPSLKQKKILDKNELLFVYSPEYSQGKKLTKKDLENVRFIWHGLSSDRTRLALMKMLKCKINEDDSLTMPDMTATKQMALKGLGVAFIANLYVHEEIKKGELNVISGIKLKRPLNLISRNEKYALPALKVFKEEFILYCEKLSESIS